MFTKEVFSFYYFEELILLKRTLIIRICSYLYILLPVFIFLLSWTKLIIGIPLSIFLAAILYKMCSQEKKTKNTIEISGIKWWKISIVIAIVLFWVLLSGIAGIAFQNKDHNCRNAVYETLVRMDWPAVDFNIGENGSMLIYYIGFWLPAAIFGKAFGIQAGYYFQVVWAVLGILLFYGLVCIYRRRFAIWPLVVFIFFSGLDTVGFLITRHPEMITDVTSHMEWWTVYQFSSFSTQLFWVFNQAVPAWILILLYMLQKNNKYLFVLSAGALLSSPLSTIGMVPFVFYFSIVNVISLKNAHKSKMINWIKSVLTPENIVGIAVNIVIGLYLIGNMAGQSVGKGNDAEINIHNILRWGGFVFLEAGIFSILTFKKKRIILSAITLGWLCICPLIRIGYSTDFCMRASIPALVILYLMVIDTLEDALCNKKRVLASALVVVLLIGSVTPAHEILRGILWTKRKWDIGEPTWQITLTQEELLQDRNFSGMLQDNFFYERIARHVK